VHGTGKTGIDAPGLSAVTTLNSERDLFLSLHADAGQGARSLSLECLDHILGVGMFRLAVDPTEAAANADILSYIDLPQP